MKRLATTILFLLLFFAPIKTKRADALTVKDKVYDDRGHLVSIAKITKVDGYIVVQYKGGFSERFGAGEMIRYE